MLRPEIKALLDDILKHPRQWTVLLPVLSRGSKVSTKKGQTILLDVVWSRGHYVIDLQKKDITIVWFKDKVVHIKLDGLPDCIVTCTTAEIEYLYDVVLRLTKNDTSQPILDELGKRF